MKLSNKVAIVTGGSSGIGLATAMLFAAEGASVVVAARDEQRGRKALLAIEKDGGNALFFRCDVSRSNDCLGAVEAAVRAFGRLDILFNNAGVIHVGKSVVDTTEEEWADTMDVNVKGCYLMSRHSIPLIAASGGGAIVNNASI
ncbi:MAG: short-chain dehydrogenase, partial [Spirochaetae bacterium HGW-Spirochaetae-7]